MAEFLRQPLFYQIIQGTISLAVFALFFSVILDFALYSREKGVEKEKRSVVETGTMTLFFFFFCLILKSRVGLIQLGSLENLLIITGTVAIVIGCFANIQGRINLGHNWANQIKIYQEHTLIQTGIYSLVRHPLYTSIILMFYGACLVYRNILAFLAVSLIFLPFMYYRAIQEEELLQERFPQYKEYKLRTGMFFPKLGRRD